MTFEQKYPEAYEDECGTVWVNKAAAEAADWTYAHGDAFLGEVLGWSMADALENWEGCKKLAKRRAFWKAHPHLRDAWWFVLRRYRFTNMFLSTVWRDWYGRISWSTAWQMAGDLWLR